MPDCGPRIEAYMRSERAAHCIIMNGLQGKVDSERIDVYSHCVVKKVASLHAVLTSLQL